MLPEQSHLPAQLFSHYSCPWVRRAFGLQFGHFVGMLNVFALGSGAELVLRFPGPNEELICESALPLGPCLPLPVPVCMPASGSGMRMHAQPAMRYRACICMLSRHRAAAADILR